MTTAVRITGNMCDGRLWSGGHGVLGRTLAERRLVVADADTGRDKTIAAMAARLLRDHPGPLLLIGFSMGGIVALEAARQAPAQIAAMVLIDSTAAADHPDRAAARPDQQARVCAGALAQIVADELKPAYLAAANRDDTAHRALLLDMALRLGPEVFVSQSEALRTRPDLGAVVAAFVGPILFLVGAEDMLCPPAIHRTMAERAQRATLRIVPGAGHMLPLEQPAVCAAAIADWLDQEKSTC